VFPISIDFQKFNSAYNLREVAELRNHYHKQFRGKKIIFSVDRLDYTKGVLNRLKGYDQFLKTYPEYLENVVFILSLVPSRDNIPNYVKRKKEIDEFIGSFNARIGNIGWKPVIYQYSHLDFNDLCALYTCSDIALITPLRDGMNLVSKEFVASRLDKQGVLLLSEMAGAARELTDAMMINPNDCEGMANIIHDALEMDKEEQTARMEIMQKRIRQYDVNAWAEDFFSQLVLIKKKQAEFEFLFLGRDEKMQLVEKYRKSSHRLLLLDYDGTLVSFSSNPAMARPDQKVLDVLNSLAADKRNEIFVISGRDSSTLENWLGKLDINLIAEHGAKQRLAGKDWTIEAAVSRQDNWKETIDSIMQKYVKRCANTFVEDKEFSIVWHYRNADPQQARIRATELFSELSGIASQMNVQVMPGNKIIEVRISGMDKGYIARNILSKKDYDFILACGDDNTDEDMFKVLSSYDNAYTLKIGDTASFANYNLYTPQMNVSLLELLSNSVHVPG
jgi:trehalose 6-phosphate synthase/phosphatase